MGMLRLPPVENALTVDAPTPLAGDISEHPMGGTPMDSDPGEPLAGEAKNAKLPGASLSEDSSDTEGDAQTSKMYPAHAAPP